MELPPISVVSTIVTGTELPAAMAATSAFRGSLGETIVKNMIHAATYDSPKISRCSGS